MELMKEQNSDPIDLCLACGSERLSWDKKPPEFGYNWMKRFVSCDYCGALMCEEYTLVSAKVIE